MSALWLPLEPHAIKDAAEIGKRMLEQYMSADEIRAHIRRLPDTHANLKKLIDAVAAMAAESCGSTSEVSELLDRASDAMEDVYGPQAKEERSPIGDFS